MASDTFMVIKEPITQQLELTQVDNSSIFLVSIENHHQYDISLVLRLQIYKITIINKNM